MVSFPNPQQFIDSQIRTYDIYQKIIPMLDTPEERYLKKSDLKDDKKGGRSLNAYNQSNEYYYMSPSEIKKLYNKKQPSDKPVRKTMSKASAERKWFDLVMKLDKKGYSYDQMKDAFEKKYKDKLKGGNADSVATVDAFRKVAAKLGKKQYGNY